jgi:hypothetical protein
MAALKVIFPSTTDTTGMSLATVRMDINTLNQQYIAIDLHFKSLVTYFWSNPSGFTPQQAFDNYGYQAADMYLWLQCHYAYRHSYTGDNTIVIPPTGHTVTPNSDGSVTAT